MKTNEGNMDRIIRIVLAVVIFGLGLAAQSWLGLIGFVPLLTGLVGWCPIYSIFGISTCPMKSKA
ncbi:MAG: DUF2892 domain-containing protein [Anaerolineae bacterium]|nr:DUF2892 domain-containing protein [Anaerolineae bacterium]MCA9894033.1 DUF2892 domain-containing protein [Anaerolineae bacterium]